MAQLGLGFVSLKLNETTISSDVLRKYVEIEPLDAAGHNLYGLALEAQGLLRSAEREFMNAAKILQREPETPVISDENKLMNTTLSMAPWLSSKTMKLKCVNTNLARLLAEKGDFVNAINQGVTADPSNGDTWTFVAYSYYGTKDYEKSCKAFEKALEISPETSKANIYIALCKLYFEQKNFEKAKYCVTQW